MRDTPSCLPASASQRPAQPRYMQFLSLSYYPFHGFIYASEAEKAQHQHPPGMVPAQAEQQQQQQTIPQPNQPQQSSSQSSMVMTTIPLPSATTLFQHFVYACQPFWCHRHTHTVPGGVVYDIGDFRVRLGDVRQTQPVARVRGTVVEIEWRGPSIVDSILDSRGDSQQIGRRDQYNGGNHVDMGNGAYGNRNGSGDGDSGIDVTFGSIEEADIDAEYATIASLIREFWARLGIEGAREAILVPDVGKEVKQRLQMLGKQQQQQQGQGHEGEDGGQPPDEDPDADAGVDVARQFMEIFRFNR